MTTPPTTTKEALEPCPFCGGEAFVTEDDVSEYPADGKVWHVTCLDSCAVAPGIYAQKTPEEAIRKWNMRSTKTQKEMLCDKHQSEYVAFHVGGCLKCWQENECDSRDSASSVAPVVDDNVVLVDREVAAKRAFDAVEAMDAHGYSLLQAAANAAASIRNLRPSRVGNAAGTLTSSEVEELAEILQSSSPVFRERILSVARTAAPVSTVAPVEQSDELAQWSSVDNWPLPDVLHKLADATEYLLNERNYDGDGWEQLKYAALAARRHVALLTAPASPAGDNNEE